MIKSKRFIKIITSALAALLIACTLFTLTGCTQYDWREDGDFEIGYNLNKPDAFVGQYFWRGHLGEDMDIVIPDFYEDAPVTSLGGYCGLGVPTPFRIYFVGTDDFKKELFGDAEAEWHAINREINGNTQEKIYAEVKEQLERYYDSTKEFEIQDLVFNLHIGSNLQKFENVYGETIKYLAYADNEEGEVLTVYAFSFVVTVDEQNEYFYSDDLGRLYYKEDNTLVNWFLYHNRDSFPENTPPTGEIL